MRQLACPCEIAIPLSDRKLSPCLLQPDAGAVSLLQRRALLIPLSGPPLSLGLLGMELPLKCPLPQDCSAVRVLPQRLELDLHREHLALQLGDVLRLRLLLHAQPCARLVEQVDGLIGQLALAQVAVRVHHARHERTVGDVHAVVGLVLLPQAAHDGDACLHRWLRHEHRLEAPGERRVLLDQAVLGKRCCPHARELAPCQLGLKQVGSIHRAVRRTGPDDRVELIDEEDHVPPGIGDIPQHRLEALLKLTSVFGASDKGADVECNHTGVAHRLRHLPVHNSLCKPLDDRSLPYSRLANQHRVVLPPA
mmetsp:Transcript_56575/g.126379  ORF Transcript_56575/g.126379 Transcript_56575/m.126379 type:complete len:308 (-) Transcript_56575:363-1286(-)